MTAGRTFTPKEVAERWGVKPAKVIALIRSGELIGFDVSSRAGGRPRFRIAPDAIKDFEKRRAAKPAPKQPRRYRKPKRKGFIDYF